MTVEDKYPCEEINKFVTVTPEEITKYKCDFENFCSKEVFSLRGQIDNESEYTKVAVKLEDCRKTLWKYVEDNYPRGETLGAADCGQVTLLIPDNKEYIWLSIMNIFVRYDQFIELTIECLYKERHISNIK